MEEIDFSLFDDDYDPFEDNMNFSDFIRHDTLTEDQRTILYNLEGQSMLLQSLNFQATSKTSRSSSFYDYISSKENDFAYKTIKLKNKINDMSKDTSIKLGRLQYKYKCTKRLGWIFILAILDGRRSNYTIKNLIEKGFDVDRHIFNIEFLPTYYYFSQVISKEKVPFSGDDNYLWHGIPYSFYNKNKVKGNERGVMSLTQYSLLAELKTIFDQIEDKNINNGLSYAEFKKSWRREKENSPLLQKCSRSDRKEKVEYEKPVFLMDLFCMQNETEKVRDFIRMNPDLALTSKICYLVQTNSDITMELFKNNIWPYQEHKKITPLHMAAKNGNLEMVAFYIEIGQELNVQDEFGNTPLHYAMMNGNKECYLYMTKKKHTEFKRMDFIRGNNEIKNIFEETPAEVFKEKNIEVIGNVGDILNQTATKRQEYESSKKFKIVKVSFQKPYKNYFKESLKVKNLETIRIEEEKIIQNIEGYIWLSLKLDNQSKNIKLEPVKKVKSKNSIFSNFLDFF